MIKKIIQKVFNIYPNAMSFRETMDLTGLPIVTFYQGEKKFNFLLDTGSNDNIIDSNILDQLNHNKIDYEGTITGLDGIVNKVTACNIDFSYKEQHYPFAYLIKDMKGPFDLMKKDYGVNLHGIIGSKFFNKFKYILDFAELIAYSKK